MITVGPGGTFSTLNAAIASITPLTPKDDIVLMSGFVMSEQLFIERDDLSRFNLVSQAAVVPINTAAIVTQFMPQDNSNPIIGVKDGGRLPKIGVLFEYPDATTSKDGIAVYNGSSVVFSPGAGVKKARRGLQVIGGSSAACYIPGLTAGDSAGSVRGVNFSQARYRALHVGFGSRAELPRSDFSYNTNGPDDDNCAVYVIWGSYADLYQSNISHCLGEAIYCRDASEVCARETNVSYSRIGYHALHGARIDARAKADSNGPYNNWEGAKNCSGHALQLTGTSFIEAPELNCDNCAGDAVDVNSASTVNLEWASIRNCGGYGVTASGGSSVTLDGATVTSKNGVKANRGSRISARDSSSSGPGYVISNGSIIQANGSSGTKSHATNQVHSAGIIFS